MNWDRISGVLIGLIVLGIGVWGLVDRESDHDSWARMTRIRATPGLIIGGIALILISLLL